MAMLASVPTTATARVRPLVVGDLPAIVELRGRLFGSRSALTGEEQVNLFRDALLDNPWRDDGICSLVYEQAGRIIGFIGATPRRLTLNGRVYRAGICQHLMVEPDSRSGLAAVALLQAFLSGPQDLSMTDSATDQTRRLMERLGASTALAHSVSWWRRLQPATCALSELRTRRGFRGLAAGAAPIGRVVDQLLAGRAANRFRHLESTTEDVDAERILVACQALGDRRRLSVDYDATWLGWLLGVWAKQEGFGRLERVLVRGPRGEPIGWFIYCVHRGDISEVLQIGATEKTIDIVLAHLVSHARTRGALTLRGRIDPRFMRAFARREFDVMPGLSWMLVHSVHPDLLQAIHRGQCFLSPLDGDLRFL